MTMEYQIEPAGEADAPALARINVLSFEGIGLLNNVFPEANQATRVAYKATFAMKHLANPSMHVLKIVDPAGDVIVGYSRWLIPETLGYGTSSPALSEQALVAARDPTAFAPKPMNELLYTSYWSLLERSRQKHTTEKDMVLDFLATLPGYQGRGIGSAMLRWGTKRADQYQSRAYLEATGAGYPLYIKYGFKPVEEVAIDRALFGGVGKETFWIMIRDPMPVQ